MTDPGRRAPGMVWRSRVFRRPHWPMVWRIPAAGRPASAMVYRPRGARARTPDDGLAITTTPLAGLGIALAITAGPAAASGNGLAHRRGLAVLLDEPMVSI